MTLPPPGDTNLRRPGDPGLGGARLTEVMMNLWREDDRSAATIALLAGVFMGIAMSWAAGNVLLLLAGLMMGLLLAPTPASIQEARGRRGESTA